MDNEALKRIDGSLQEIHIKVNQIAINQAETSVKLQSHLNQINGRSIHHTPPCDSLSEHEDAHHRGWRLLLWALGVGIAAGGLVSTLVLGILTL